MLLGESAQDLAQLRVLGGRPLHQACRRSEERVLDVALPGHAHLLVAVRSFSWTTVSPHRPWIGTVRSKPVSAGGCSATATGVNGRYGFVSPWWQHPHTADRAGQSEEVTVADKAAAILAGLGGAENIEDIEACITRLRCEVVDGGKVDQAALKAAGAHGVMQQGTVVQVVVGPEADNLADDIQDLM
ncbi:PTS glucose/sucrose transporter subunit IIB [Crossiella sp. SN42]|uniref:PTS glucose/sucrose transporter subunit IIB n=1 Tax=Crossiella sp. SN42 TaxID=2944808 RepID=UPI0027E0F404|nr:PTS glucose/sucrose transporter subunit IIB [Crossiella sp. SN42]